MNITSETELAEAIAGAAAPLRIRGGGTRDIGNPVAAEDVMLTRGLSGVELYEPGALTLIVRAGTPLAEVEALLATEGQRLAFEPMDHRGLLATKGVPTIGGMVAANVSGPRRIQAGACRDYLLGVRFVDGMGRIIRNGGRVMKNVTGYDLVKLMAGSFGTLGVLSELSLKVLPAAEAQASLRLSGLDDTRAVQALGAALAAPFDVTGAAHMAGETFVRIEGFADSVAYRAKKLAAHLAVFGAVEIIEGGADIWQSLRDVVPFSGRVGDVWRISVKPSDGPRVGAALRTCAEDFEVIYDWGGGLVWALTPEGFDLRTALRGIEGHARIERATPATRARLGAFPPETPALARLSAGVRARFDPRGILNPGLMATAIGE